MWRSLLQNPLHFPHFPKLLTCHCFEAHRLDNTICYSLVLSCVPSSPITCLSTEVRAACTVHASTLWILLLTVPVAKQLCQTFWQTPPQTFVLPRLPHLCSAGEVLLSLRWAMWHLQEGSQLVLVTCFCVTSLQQTLCVQALSLSLSLHAVSLTLIKLATLPVRAMNSNTCLSCVAMITTLPITVAHT